MHKPYKAMSFFDFQKRYGTEKACKDKLFAFKWPNGFRCPRCACNEHYFLETKELYQCKQCKHQTSLTVGTVMQRTRTPLMKWFWAIFLVSTDKRGLSALSLSRKIGVTYKTAWLMLHKIRLAMESRDAEYQLAGFIQVDDAFFKGGQGNGGDKSGRGTRKVPVVVMAAFKEDALTFAKMKVIENVDSKNIKSTLREHVTLGQTIMSDGLPAYNIAKTLGHTHLPHVVYPKKGEPDFDAFKWINILVSNAKAFILGTYHGVRKKHLQKYLDEFCYRFNRRWWPDELFDRLLMACTGGDQCTFAELTG